MAGVFPGGTKTFPTLVDGPAGDTCAAALFTQAYDEITAIEGLASKTEISAYFSRTYSMSANLSLADSDSPLQWLDPNGSARDITLPANATANHIFIIINTADAAETITVKNSGGTAIGTVAQGETKIFVPGGAAWAMVSGGGGASGRPVLTANRTYYVRTDGNDLNTGLANTSGGAFLTIQKAVDTIASLDISTCSATIQVADGTYTGAVVLKDVVGCGSDSQLYLTGNTSTPANCIISVTGSDAIKAAGHTWNVNGFKIQTTTSGNCVQSSRGNINLSNINFGSCATNHMDISGIGSVTIQTNYSISGGCNAGAHVYCVSGNWYCNIRTVTFLATVAFQWFCYALIGGKCFCLGNTYSLGAYTVTGTRYSAYLNGVINTNGGGANYFPGNTAGSATSGGQYV